MVLLELRKPLQHGRRFDLVRGPALTMGIGTRTLVKMSGLDSSVISGKPRVVWGRFRGTRTCPSTARFCIPEPDARWQVPLDTRAMPPKTHLSIPLTLHPPETWKIRKAAGTLRRAVRFCIPTPQHHQPEHQGPPRSRRRPLLFSLSPFIAGALGLRAGPNDVPPQR
jgi:hypothetical protein